MGSAQKIPSPQAGTIGVIDELTFHSRLVTTTAGTLATAALGLWTPGGQTLVKTAATTGRYTLTLPTPFTRLVQVILTGIGPNTATWGAATTGYDAFVRDDDVSNTAVAGNPTVSNQDGSIEIQFTRTDTNADAELPDAAQVMITVIVARGATS